METASSFSESENQEVDEQPEDEGRNDAAILAQSLLEQRATIHLLSHGEQLELCETVSSVILTHGERLGERMRKLLRRMRNYLCYITSGRTASGKSIIAKRAREKRKRRNRKKAAKGAQSNGEDAQQPSTAPRNPNFNLLEMAQRLNVDVGNITLVGQVFGSVKPPEAAGPADAAANSQNEQKEQGQTESLEQATSNGSEMQPLSAEEPGNRQEETKVAEEPIPTDSPIHILSGSTVKYLDNGGYNTVLKKSILIPAIHCGILMGRRGSTLRMIEVITSSILTFGHWNDTELWCFVTVVTDNKRQQDSALALLHFLLKYRISLKYDEIVKICRQADPDESIASQDSAANAETDVTKDRDQESLGVQNEVHPDTTEQTDNVEQHEDGTNLPEGTVIEGKPKLEASGQLEEDATRSVTVSESESDYEDHSADEDRSPNDEQATFQPRIPEENQCSLEESITMNDDMVKLLGDGNGKIAKVIQHFSSTFFSFLEAPEGGNERPILVIKAMDEGRIQCAKDFIDLLTRYDVQLEKACDPNSQEESTIVGQGADLEKNLPPSSRRHLIPTNLAWLVPSRNFNCEKSSPARMLRICQDGLSMDFGIPLDLQVELRQMDSYMEDWNFLSNETLRGLYEMSLAELNGMGASENDQGISTRDGNTDGDGSSTNKAPRKCCPYSKRSGNRIKQSLSHFFRANEATDVKNPLHGKKKEICEHLDIMRPDNLP